MHPSFRPSRLRWGVLLLGLCAGVVGGQTRVVLEGEVISSEPSGFRIVLRHDSVPGLFPGPGPYETTFSTAAGDAALAVPGQRVRGEAFTYLRGFRLERLYPVDLAAERTLREVNRRLREDTVARGSRAFRAVGEYMPDFALYDQDGKVVQPRDWRGQKVVLNFIFTRCDQPQMCPAATQRMARLQAEAAAAEVPVLLISITLDPAYDSPGILRQYADERGLRSDNFRLLTGPEAVIHDLLRQFGIVAYAEDGTIKHTMATLLIDERGQIQLRRDGSRWSTGEFLERLR